jgi:hypothetical protein
MSVYRMKTELRGRERENVPFLVLLLGALDGLGVHVKAEAGGPHRGIMG